MTALSLDSCGLILNHSNVCVVGMIDHVMIFRERVVDRSRLHFICILQNDKFIHSNMLHRNQVKGSVVAVLASCSQLRAAD
jgi:hypothetical protein